MVGAAARAEFRDQSCDGAAAGAGAERLRLAGIAERAEGAAFDPAVHEPVVSAAGAGLDDRRDAGPAEVTRAVFGASMAQPDLPAAHAGLARVGALFAGGARGARPAALPLVPADSADVDAGLIGAGLADRLLTAVEQARGDLAAALNAVLAVTLAVNQNAPCIDPACPVPGCCETGTDA